MEYENEFEKLKAGSGETWKPEIGAYNIEILEEPENTEFTAEDGKVTPQWKVPIKVNDKEYIWYMTKGKTFVSAFGQLVLLGKAYINLKGHKFNVLVMKLKDRNQKEKNQYTITEAIPLMKEATVKEEKVE